MPDDDFDFDKINEGFDADAIAYEEVAKLVVPMFMSYRKAGLSVQESASLTAAMVAHTMPMMPQKPQED